MNTLDAWETLIVRACKDNGDTLPRLRRIWQLRCGMGDKYYNDADKFLAFFLGGILQKSKTGFWFEQFLLDIDPQNSWKYPKDKTGEELSYWDRTLLALRSQIRFTKPDEEWAGFRKAYKFRKLEAVS